MLKELASSLSWLDYGLIVIGVWWAWDHGGAAAAAKVKAVFASGKAVAGDVIVRVEKLEAEVFGAKPTAADQTSTAPLTPPANLHPGTAG